MLSAVASLAFIREAFDRFSSVQPTPRTVAHRTQDALTIELDYTASREVQTQRDCACGLQHAHRACQEFCV
jgi:hypothetical protein